VIRFEGRLPI